MLRESKPLLSATATAARSIRSLLRGMGRVDLFSVVIRDFFSVVIRDFFLISPHFPLDVRTPYAYLTTIPRTPYARIGRSGQASGREGSWTYHRSEGHRPQRTPERGDRTMMKPLRLVLILALPLIASLAATLWPASRAAKIRP